MKKTTLDDMWKVLTPRQCALAAADIAELVLHVYEKKYPGDGRPREAIKAARGNDKNKAQVAANAAANAAYAAAPAANAAHAASYAAANAANAAYFASYAAYAAYAAAPAANAANAAANAAAHAAHAAYFAKKSNKRTKKEMELEQMHIAIDYLIGDRGE